MSRDTAHRLLNLVFYQVGWFACVLGAARGLGLAGAAAGVGLWLVHLSLSRDRPTEAKIAAACFGIGLLADSIQGAAGRLVFAGSPWPLLAPPWVLALWLLIAATLRSALSWLSGRYALAAILGAVAGPLAYLAGERLGAAEIGEPRWLSVVSLAVEWGCATPAIVSVADRIGAGRPTGYRWP